jgi:hypothetical protein
MGDPVLFADLAPDLECTTCVIRGRLEVPEVCEMVREVRVHGGEIARRPGLLEDRDRPRGELRRPRRLGARLGELSCKSVRPAERVPGSR